MKKPERTPDLDDSEGLPNEFNKRAARTSAKSLSENCHEWFDKLSDESESEDIHSKESDTTNGRSSVRPVRLFKQNIFGLRRYGERCRRTVKRPDEVFG